jgi:type I restriction enzyme, S subunit
LPEGWTVCCLENVAKVLDYLRKPINSNERNSRIANKHENELFPYYGATGQVGFIDDYLVDGTFLLLGEDGAPFLDKYAIKSYPIKGKCWVNNHAHILEPLCDFDYLMYYLNHVDYKDYVNGSTRLKLTQSDMRSIIILLPPLTEQKRISVKVKYLFRLLDSIACHL